MVQASILAVLDNIAVKRTEPQERPSNAEIGTALTELREDYAERGLEVREVASGFRIQVREDVNPWVARLYQPYHPAVMKALAQVAELSPLSGAPTIRPRRRS